MAQTWESKLTHKWMDPTEEVEIIMVITKKGEE
jgi:hypothetical protein